MVRADLGASGVMFSIDTESGFRDAILINAAYGLGENVVQGSVNPDEIYVFKPTPKQGYRPVKKTLETKEFKLVYDVGGSKMTKNVPVPPDDRGRFTIGLFAFVPFFLILDLALHAFYQSPGILCPYLSFKIGGRDSRCA